jgi:two-component system response regulator
VQAAGLDALRLQGALARRGSAASVNGLLPRCHSGARGRMGAETLSRPGRSVLTDRLRSHAKLYGQIFDGSGLRQLTASRPERRKAARRKLLKGGVIAFQARHATFPCVVRDLSDTGARLQISQPAIPIPDRFDLIVELDGLEVPCHVVRRDQNGLGVRFLAAPSFVPPKRAQVVSAPVSGQKSSFRRAPIAPLGPAPADPETRLAVTAEADPPAGTAPRPAGVPLVVADDDPDDRMLIDDAFREVDFPHPYTFVEDGVELLRHLRAEAPYEARPKPGLVMLDLNMPRMDGRSALRHIRSDFALRRTPVIVMTTSTAEDDIRSTYDLGVSGYFPKPTTIDGLTELVECLDKYWLRMACLPA